MCSLFPPYLNIIRTILVYYFLQNFLFKSNSALKVFTFSIAIFQPHRTLRMSKILYRMKYSKNSDYTIGQSGGIGGTSGATQSFIEWISQSQKIESTRNCFQYVIVESNPLHGASLDRVNNTYVLDSKLALICVFLFKFNQTRFILFTWNHADFSYRLSELMTDRKNVKVLDFAARRRRQYVKWDDEMIIPVPGESQETNPSNDFSRQGEVFMVGRLTYQKGIDRFLKLAYLNPGVLFHVFGDGPLRNLLIKQKTNNVVFHGYVDEPFKQIGSMDLLIISSRFFEGVPLVLLEALKREIVVLSSGIGDLKLVNSKYYISPDSDKNFVNFADSQIKKFFSSRTS
jgi:glycosyltransferase involved in cell wall biosynthesis